MKLSFTLTICIFSSFKLFGQNQKLFVNDSLIEVQTTTCWPLLKKSQVKEFKNYDFQLKKAEIVDDNLVLDIAYGGGCGSVYFNMYVDSSFDLQEDSIVQIFPEFISYDPCEAMRYIKLCFDLEILREGRRKPALLKIGQFVFNLSVK